MKNILLHTVFFIFVLNSGNLEAATKNSDSAESLIRDLYEKHQPQKGQEIAFDDAKTLRLYFTDDLIALFMRNEECIMRTRGVCNLNMDPLLAAQDYDDSPRKLDVKKIKSNKSLLQFNVTFTNMKQRNTLIYELIKTKSGWRISDIIYPSNNRLSKLLSVSE